MTHRKNQQVIAKFKDDPALGEAVEMLLWLRNHYDVGLEEHKPDVLAEVDELLNVYIGDHPRNTR